MNWKDFSSLMFLWLIPYPLIVLLTGEFDFRGWNMFVRVIYFLYCMFWILAAIVGMVELEKQKKKERENKEHV